MNSPRFFYPEPLKAHTHAPLPDALAHYAVRVLRLKTGAHIRLFDGYGGEYKAQLVCEGKNVQAIVGDHTPREAELRGRICLVQGLAATEKMDWIVEKAVELGAAEFIPVAAQRSTTQLRGERLEKRLAHWQRIAQSASEQCGRNRIMRVQNLCTFAQCLERLSGAVFLCHPDYGVPLSDAIQAANEKMTGLGAESPELTLLIGPEGGWSDAELALAKQHGVDAVQFGTRILRTETAGLALIAACTALLEWYR